MRFIDTEPYKGARVRALSRTELVESYPVRATLEELAGQLAAPRSDAELLRRLGAEVENMRRAARRQDQHALLMADARFHELIVTAAGNSVLLETWRSLRIETFTLVSLVTSSLDLAAIAEAHLPILDALREGDADLSGKVMREHIATFADHLLTGDKS
jgi:DNA-binding GntR family transcriptional regulator